MPANLRAHAWTVGIFLAAVVVLWIVIANPTVLLWIAGIGVAAFVYYVLYLLVRARFEGIDEPAGDA